jgi:hypothetical protein
MAAAGGKNTFLCTSGSCAVVQATAPRSATRTSRALTAAAATNMAKCNKTTGLTQSCVISQTSATADNVAIVVERAKQASSLMQTLSATVSAQITQQASGSNNNQACVYQEITETLTPTNAKKGVAVNTTLDAQQSVLITQNAATGGNTVQNAAAPPATADCVSGPLTQTQTLASRATGTAAITQKENAAASSPYVNLDIKQNQDPAFESASGPNAAAFSQTSTLTAAASTSAGPVTQTQGSANGGIQATVKQFSHGVSNASATQTETQCEHAQASGSPTCSTGNPPSYSLTQTQVGPISSGDRHSQNTGSRKLAYVKKGACPPDCSTQTDNAADTFTIGQSSTQSNDTGNGQSNTLLGDCATSGNCTVTENTNINGVPSSNTQSGSNVNTQTVCSGSTCTSSGPTSSGELMLLPNGLSVTNTDVAESGYGGMRGTGTGTIQVSGVTGPVTHAFLYWNGPTNSADPAANASVTFNGTGVTGTNIGFASPNCWPFDNSQSYRADVTSLVAGNGTYSLANFTKADADINGVSLIVFYSDANSGNDRTIVLWNGNDSNKPSTFDPPGWDETITGVPYPGSGVAKLDFVAASDGQHAPDDEILLNGQSVVPVGPTFEGDSTPHGDFDLLGDLWDVKTGLIDITSFLTQGSNNTLHLTSGAPGNDCVSLVVVAANVPAH